ncbi:MAG: RecX family transcriptional regulator [Abditibacteriota bacterium]|nr:RecX family transcriptional regulator [Abditibacteriota bacterium]
MKITAIKPQQNNPERVNIYIDGEFFCGLDAFHLYGLSLKKGAELTEEQLRTLAGIRDQEACTRKAMNLLAYRDRSGFELKKRLRAEGYGEANIEETLKLLRGMGLLNDAEFVRNYAASANGRLPRGRVLSKLAELGVPFSFAEPIVEEVMDPGCELAAATELAAKKLRLLRGGTGYERRDRLYRYLRGRGFDGDTISKALSEIPEELQ